MQTVIRLKDGIEVEVEVSENQAREISGGSVVNSSIDEIQGLLTKLMSPIANTYRELDKSMSIESAKVSVGVKVG
ncbi:MAG: hypothetical protein KUG64_08965, partial [Cycloclasticus sp.]|nr:hypothetical protein [Cycloclasticus sp.]